MASTAAAARLTELHRVAQSKVGAATVRQVLNVWQLLDPQDLDGTVVAWLDAAIPAIQLQHQVSTQLAANYVMAFRALELPGEAAVPAVLAEPLDVTAVQTSLVVTGPVRIKSAMRDGVGLTRAVENAKAGAAQAAMRHALSGGRGTITRSVASDRRAVGWARATSGNACAFCAMLASRGPVYSEQTADFEAHDGCGCTAEPVYRRDAAWPAGSRDYAALWKDTTRGLSGSDAMSAFRAAVEGRSSS